MGLNYEMNMPVIQDTTTIYNEVAATIPSEVRPTASQVTNGGHPSTEADLPLNNPSEPRQAPMSTPVSGAATLKRREGGSTLPRPQNTPHRIGDQPASPRDPSRTTVRQIIGLQSASLAHCEHIKMTRIGELENDYRAGDAVVDLRGMRPKRLRVYRPNGSTTAAVLYAPNKQLIDDLPRCKPGS